jgi:hypothetical protein
VHDDVVSGTLDVEEHDIGVAVLVDMTGHTRAEVLDERFGLATVPIRPLLDRLPDAARVIPSGDGREWHRALGNAARGHPETHTILE